MTHLLRHMRYAALAAPVALLGSAALAEGDGTELESQAEATLQECTAVADTCAEAIETAAGVLVFPEVLEADLIVGGAGGDGVLFADGEVQGYYDIGKASVGLQAGIDQKAMVLVFRDEQSLANLTDGSEWEVGAEAGITVVDASADSLTESGEPVVYVFDAEGLSADVDVNGLRIWEDDENAS